VKNSNPDASLKKLTSTFDIWRMFFGDEGSHYHGLVVFTGSVWNAFFPPSSNEGNRKENPVLSPSLVFVGQSIPTATGHHSQGPRTWPQLPIKRPGLLTWPNADRRRFERQEF